MYVIHRRYVHICKGPNRVGFVGLFQPFSDAIKLLTREQYFPLVSNYLSYYFSPIFRLFRLIISRGLLNLIPSITFWWFILSACNIAAPPSLNLLGEIRLLNRLILLVICSATGF
jgi:NADH:ubiquinone oxidoreductase subunit H